MSLHPSEPKSAQGGARSPRSRGSDLGVSLRPRSRMPGRLVAGGLSALLLAVTVARLPSAIRAGLHQGTRGFWVATTRKCARSACTWNGKFVSDGHVLLSSAQYYGRLPVGIRAGTSVAGLFTGGSGVVFPATGSDLWMSLLVALAVAALGLYWSSHRLVRSYIRQRRSAAD